MEKDHLNQSRQQALTILKHTNNSKKTEVEEHSAILQHKKEINQENLQFVTLSRIY